MEEQTETVDRLAGVSSLVTALRWGTVLIGFTLAVIDGDEAGLIGGLLLAIYTIWRTLHPLRYGRHSFSDFIAVLFELALVLGVIAATDFWNSPYIFACFPIILAAGFARGFGFALTIAATAIATIAIPFHITGSDERFRTTLEWGAEMLLLAMVSAYGHRLFYEGAERTTLALSRVSQLAEVNTLLFELSQKTKSLSSSLDLQDSLDSTVQTVKELLHPDSIAILLRDETSPSWLATTVEGVRIPLQINDNQLPEAFQQALNETEALFFELNEQFRGLSPQSRTGIYVALRARGSTIGLLAIESRQPDTLTKGQLGLVNHLSEQGALAIDNARWFDRLRTIGVEEERTRIARDLHDRVGQSLAYLGFELDRLVSHTNSETINSDLQTLRQDVRRVVGEVRDTLYDLRTDVTESDDLVTVLDGFLSRVKERAQIETVFRHKSTKRLPLPQEREIWRIAQEAIANAERHARAGLISVLWQSEEDGALLEVGDDGRGFSVDSGLARRDSYGLLGMKERADAIGAVLEISSTPGKGTIIRCRLKQL